MKKAAKILSVSALIAVAGCASSPPPLPQVADGQFQPVASKEWKDYIQNTRGKPAQ